MPTLKDLRLEAHLTVAAFSREAKIDMKTIKRAEEGSPVQEVKVVIMLDTLSKLLGRRIKLGDVEGLNIYGE